MQKTLLLFIAILISLNNLSSPGAAKKQKTKKFKPSGIYGELFQVGFPPDIPYNQLSLPSMLVGIYQVYDKRALAIPRSEVTDLNPGVVGGRREVKRVRTNKYGNFKVTLPPGTYLVEPIPPTPDPNMMGGIYRSREVVRVWQGFYTKAEVTYNAGW